MGCGCGDLAPFVFFPCYHCVCVAGFAPAATPTWISLSTVYVWHFCARMYACNFTNCAYVGTRACYLAAHKRVHIDQPSNQCEHENCTACFTSAASLRTHQLCAHTGEKPYACGASGCSYRAFSKVLLWRHKFRHEATCCYVCEVPGCVFGAQSRRALVKHSMMCHNMVPPPKNHAKRART